MTDIKHFLQKDMSCRGNSATNKVVFEKLRNKLVLVCTKYSLPVPELQLSNHKALNGQFRVTYNVEELAKANTMDEIIQATSTMTIKISKYICEYFDYERAEQTLLHEMAHFLDFIVTKKCSHTYTFDNALAFLGGNKTSERFVSQKVGFIYKCPCGRNKKKTIRRISAKVLGGYMCSDCKTVMKYWNVKQIG